MKKKILVLLSVILVLLAAAGIYLYRNHQRLENFPDKELVWMQLDTKGAEFALPQIEGYKRDDLLKKWGDPDHSTEEPQSDSWQITDDASIVIYYSADAVVENIELQK